MHLVTNHEVRWFEVEGVRICGRVASLGSQIWAQKTYSIREA